MYSMVITTTDSKEAAKKLASIIVANKMAACVQVTKIESFYTWEGKVQDEAEYVMFIKTRKSLYTDLEKLILKNHSYDTPEIIMVPIENGSDAYLKWIDEVTR